MCHPTIAWEPSVSDNFGAINDKNGHLIAEEVLFDLVRKRVFGESVNVGAVHLF